MHSDYPNPENTENAVKEFRRFLETIHTLRSPNGCPWDREQTPLSMRKPLIEETFEAVDAITQEDVAHAKEELGDVLLNTAMISYMYEQDGAFTIADSIRELTDKLIRRHPHVWPQSQGASQADGKAETSSEVLSQWERIKQNVESRKSDSILDEVPQGFPPLLRAAKLQKKAAKKGFEWNNISEALQKVQEELAEVQAARLELENKCGQESPFLKDSSENINSVQLHVEEEIGDLLFAVVNYSRMLGVDPETALNRTNQKFYRRFTYVERQMEQNKIPQDKNHLKEAEHLWTEAKTKGL